MKLVLVLLSILALAGSASATEYYVFTLMEPRGAKVPAGALGEARMEPTAMPTHRVEARVVLRDPRDLPSSKLGVDPVVVRVGKALMAIAG